MTIKKRLYLAFGSIVVIVVVLFVVNTSVVVRGRVASEQATVALQSVQSLEVAQLKMMQIRLALQDYLADYTAGQDAVITLAWKMEGLIC